MATKRYRMRFDFQLNVAKDDENAIAEQIDELKSQALYSKTVRDGIRLDERFEGRQSGCFI